MGVSLGNDCISSTKGLACWVGLGRDQGGLEDVFIVCQLEFRENLSKKEPPQCGIRKLVLILASSEVQEERTRGLSKPVLSAWPASLSECGC